MKRLIVFLLLMHFAVFQIAGANEIGSEEQVFRVVCVKKTADLSKVLAGENTQYIIRYNHDLSRYKDGVVIGKNSILEFRKGSLNNGKIVFNNTHIKSKVSRIFSNNVYDGLINVPEAYPEWFGAEGNGLTDDTRAIQDALNVSNTVSGISGKVYAVRTASPFNHCLEIKRDSLTMNINLKDINEYSTSDYRGRGVIFLDNKSAFSFSGSITTVNVKLPVSAETGMTLEKSRAGIVCYGDCIGLDINLTCSNLYCGVTNGAFMYDEYLYRNGTEGINHSKIKVIAYRVAYPVALNYANHCEVDVTGEHMHRCVYLCGEYNTVIAKGRNYYATAAPAHILLLSNVLKDKEGRYKIVTCNHNNVTYRQLEGETDNMQEGSVFQFQELRLDLNQNVPHTDYSFIDNTINLYCCKLGGEKIQHLYKSFASNWVYDKSVIIEGTFNIFGDITSYLSFASFVFYSNTLDRLTINNYTDQQLVYTFSYSGNPHSKYIVNGDSKSRSFGTREHPFKGTLKVKGRNIYVNTTVGSPSIDGDIYLEGDNIEVIQNPQKHRNHVHIQSK